MTLTPPRHDQSRFDSHQVFRIEGILRGKPVFAYEECPFQTTSNCISSKWHIGMCQNTGPNDWFPFGFPLNQLEKPTLKKRYRYTHTSKPALESSGGILSECPKQRGPFLRIVPPFWCALHFFFASWTEATGRGSPKTGSIKGPFKHPSRPPQIVLKMANKG